MLSNFISTHREEILVRAQVTFGKYFPNDPPALSELSTFVEGLLLALEHDSVRDPGASRQISIAARSEGLERRRTGFSIEGVVRCFGAVCESVTGLAADRGFRFDPREMQVLNQCVDQAVATGISEYTAADKEAHEHRAAERLGFLAHELRNSLSAASMAFEALQGGQVGLQGSTSAVLRRSLRRMSTLIAHSLAAARLQAKGTIRRERISVSAAMREIEAALPPPIGQTLTVTVDPDEQIDADPDLFASAMSNLIQNAQKFSSPDGHVEVRVIGTDDALVIEVEDRCGGLPMPEPERLFDAFHQEQQGRGGAGLGLAIAREAVESHGGTIAVRDLKGVGCVFTLRWPRSPSYWLTGNSAG